MAFGQQAGPPATGRQVQQLGALMAVAGLTDFRDARGPLGLTQRQAAGKFTRDEADALIARLEAEAEPPGADVPAPPPPSAPTAAAAARPRVSGQLRAVPSEHLAAELQRRGWVVMEP
jgi:hypothetical protein